MKIIKILSQTILRRKRSRKLEEEKLKLRQQNTELKKKLDELEKQNEAISARLFSLERFPSDADINFYTGLANYATFLALRNFLNPGENGENIRQGSTLKDVPEDFYDVDSDDDEENITPAKKGRPRKLKPVEEFFIVLCRLRRAFSERHLAHFCGVARSTISRLFVPWINFMYLKFGQMCIWPSKSVVQATMPADFKEKFPSMRVIIDCTEVFCEMPSSFLLNSELFSSYKNHVTLKGLVRIAPSGGLHFAVSFIPAAFLTVKLFCGVDFCPNPLMMVMLQWQTRDFRYKTSCPLVRV